MQVGGNAFSGTYSNALPGTSQRRRLTASTGILNPMLCLQKSDSILFSISGASYPVYMKDSLMNTNPSFDYGPFRSLQEAMASNASSVSAFAYTFTAAGTYVFALSNNSAALTIVTVMETVRHLIAPAMHLRSFLLSRASSAQPMARSCP